MVRTQVNNIILSGVSGSGKSTVGRHLAIILGFGFIDLDAFIEKRIGLSIDAIWNSRGEEAFRVIEAQALQEIRNIRGHVVALGGGALQVPDNVQIAKSLGPVIWLKPSSQEIARRFVMKVDELEKRPLLKEFVKYENKDERLTAIHNKIAAMTDQRSASFQIADVVLDGGFVTPETSACQLKDILDSMGYSVQYRMTHVT